MHHGRCHIASTCCTSSSNAATCNGKETKHFTARCFVHEKLRVTPALTQRAATCTCCHFLSHCHKSSNTRVHCSTEVSATVQAPAAPPACMQWESKKPICCPALFSKWLGIPAMCVRAKYVVHVLKADTTSCHPLNGLVRCVCNHHNTSTSAQHDQQP